MFGQKLSKQNKAAITAWLLLSVVIIAAQLFNDSYQYVIAMIILASFFVELFVLTQGKMTERNGFIVNFTFWSYLWRTVLILFVCTVLVVTLAMIFFPDDFIHHRVTTLMVITLSHFLLIYLIYRPKNIVKR
jgi:uncharacterized membrane protein